MGFYDITNSSKMQFQFDKIFRNRKEMDEAALAGTDGIFQGRFVLVKYDTTDLPLFEGDVTLGYLNETTGAIYSDASMQTPYVYSGMTHVNNPAEANWSQYYLSNGNFYFKLPSVEYFNTTEQNYYTANVDAAALAFSGQLVRIIEPNMKEPTQIYYRCTGGTEGQPAQWELVLPDEDLPEYIQNYNIDRVTYSTDFDVRGYDATVWEKLQNGRQGHFVLIAYLNGMIPSLEIVPEPPSEFTAVPYIDSLSSNMLYRLHMPTTWGFRIKEVEQNETSDQKVTQRYQNYNETNQLIGEDLREIDADIYFNKAGFDRASRNYDTDNINEILVSPTGESGKTYYDNNGNAVTTDIQELSIHLPAIGNVISDFHDKVYGQERHLDTTWYNGDDSRRDTGGVQLNYKTYDLDTAAGIINTLQSRLGQNIVPLSYIPSDAQAYGLSNNYIYQVGDNYFRKGNNITYEIIPEYSNLGHLSVSRYTPNTYYILSNGSFTLAGGQYTDYDESTEFYRKNITYKDIGTLTADQYAMNTYYLDSNGENIATQPYEYYSSSQHFYEKNVSAIKYGEVSLMGYVPSTYYYKQEYNDGIDNIISYVLDSNTLPNYNNIYYNITSENILGPFTFDAGYQPNIYYKRNEQGDLIVESSQNPDAEETYYALQNITVINNGNVSLLYEPNTYFYYDRDLESYVIDDSETMRDNYTYYSIPYSDTKYYTIINGQLVEVKVLDLDHAQRVNLFDRSAYENVYYYNNNRYINFDSLSEEDKKIARVYYTMTAVEVESFFIPYTYYALSNGNYILQTTFSQNREYYQLQNVKALELPFYRGDTYYYNNGDIYLIDTSITITEGRTYYTSTPLYVYSDTTGRWPQGYEWKEQAVFVPASVTLATGINHSTIYNLSNINNGDTSINGAILKIDQFLNTSDVDSRDISTVMGLYNTLKDLLQSITSNLIPGRILYVNEFGQIACSNIKVSDLS